MREKAVSKLSIQDIYELSIKFGVDTDPRGTEEVEKYLARLNKEFESLSVKEKDLFDKELLTNPYADTRILFGDPQMKISKVFVGIDIGTAELLLAERLNQKGEGIDLVIAHHPEGIALTTLHEVMPVQTGFFGCCGVPINAAEHILNSEMRKTGYSMAVINYNQAADAARLLEFPFMCIHTPADNAVQHYVENLFKAQNPDTLGDILDILNEEPEYQAAHESSAGPQILNGSRSNRVGKIMVDMTGGTDAGKGIYQKMADAGVGTIVAMHMRDEVKEVLEENHINIVLAGHMSSDSIGMNLILDQIHKQGVEIIAGSGLTYFSRL